MRRAAGVGGLLVVALVLVALAFGAPDDDGGRLDPSSNGPDGARGLRILLERLGARVDVGDGAPAAGADTAVILRDLLHPDDHLAALGWVEAGGVLLVADASSPLVAGAVDADCPAALADVASLPVGDGDRLERDDGGSGSCFGGAVRVDRRGEGVVVAVSTAAPFTNELLDEADAAVLAAGVLVPSAGTTVAWPVGPSRPPAASGEEDLLDLVPSSVRQALLQVAVAAAVWVLWRGRRLGHPVDEDQPVAIAGSELVVAVGRLQAARHRPDEAAATLRGGLRRGIEARLGLPLDAPVPATAAAVADRTGLVADDVAAALGDRPVTTDDELVALCAELDRIRAATLGSTT